VNILNFLAKRSHSFLLAGGILLVILIGLVDYLTGPEISFSIFYLLPVSLVAWIVGRWAGFLISAASAIMWLVADVLTAHMYSFPAILYWNAVVRFGLFLVVTLSLSALSASQRRRDDLTQFLFHDLRSPLANVISALRVAREREIVEKDADLNDLIKMSLVSCSRMSTLIQSLLDLARLENGQLQPQREKAGAKELIESSLAQVSVWAARNGVALTSQLATDIGTVYADPALTERVLVNLLSNAVKFSPRGSVVTVRGSRVAPNTVAISVADKGPGIPREWTKRVFEKFAQATVARTGDDAGTGLGLTFCRLAMEAQGGHIRLESEINVGTTITITLPESEA